MHITVITQKFSPEEHLQCFASGNRNAGALASFVGYCRTPSYGHEVESLELEHYPGFTEAEITNAADDIARRHGLIDVLVVHRVGRISVGDAIVLAAALSEHRAAAFVAVNELMDWLKTDAPVWKKEIRADGSTHWVEPTDTDRSRRARLASNAGDA